MRPPIDLAMSRQSSIVSTRLDVDQSMVYDEVVGVETALHDDILVPWKADHGFVGSCYINIGDDAHHGEYTDWDVSGPLHQAFMALGNEIGTHSYTHPDDISHPPVDLEFELKDSRDRIGQELGITVYGAAIPGNWEPLWVADALQPYQAYLTGGWSGKGAAKAGAFAYLTPAFGMVYFTPNMVSDYAMIEFWGWTPVQARDHWQQEFAALAAHAQVLLIHWTWHDYGPTVGVTDWGLYSVEMFSDIVTTVHACGAESATVYDVRCRIGALAAANLQVGSGEPVVVDVSGDSLGALCAKGSARFRHQRGG